MYRIHEKINSLPTTRVVKTIPIDLNEEEENKDDFNMVENQILITELNNIKKLLNDLYEEINDNYIETLGRDDELAIDCADAQLNLIKEIIDKVGKI